MVKPGIYKHYKGGIYQVLHVATNTETGREYVIYRKVSEKDATVDSTLWARPIEMFKESVEQFESKVLVPRFERII